MIFDLVKGIIICMKFGGLSEKESNIVSEILNEEGIPFSIDKDQEIESFNTSSMKNDLRHYAPPNISTHILAITIEDEHFQKLSISGRAKLLDLGITDEAPSPEDFKSFEGETIHRELIEGPRRMVAFNFKHQLVLALMLLIIFWFFKFKNSL